MLQELQKRAFEADEAFSSYDETVSEWYGILSCSERLKPILDLGISDESKKLLTGLVDISSTLDKTYNELEAKKNELALEYALEKVGGKLGDIIDYEDHSGRSRAIVIESAHMIGSNICIYGTRFLQSGHIGRIPGSVNLDIENWKLRK